MSAFNYSADCERCGERVQVAPSNGQCVGVIRYVRSVETRVYYHDVCYRAMEKKRLAEVPPMPYEEYRNA